MMICMKRSALLSASLFLTACLCAAMPVTAMEEYYLEIIKSTSELRLKQGADTLKTYHIAFGKGDAGPKRQLGDNRTPVGFYRILDFRPESKFHFFMQISYPNLLDAWHGYREQLISPAEFKQIALAFRNHELPPQNTRLGGYIGIHGIGDDTERLKLHAKANWTEGCIAITNDEINDLRQYVIRGTPVYIRN
jgi:murein L,D-transpeptidase YafK